MVHGIGRIDNDVCLYEKVGVWIRKPPVYCDPQNIYGQKGWQQGTRLSLIEGIDGSLIIREIKEQKID